MIASIRRTLAALEPSAVTLKMPISAVLATCVPPQSSRETPSISTTRTHSPYFSPNRAIAPSASASGRSISSQRTGALALIHSLTRSSTSRSSSGLSDWPWVKSKRSLSGRTAEPAWRTWVPSRSRSAACRRCVAVWLRIVAWRVSRSTTASTSAPGRLAVGLDREHLVAADPVDVDDLGLAAVPAQQPESATWPPPSA